MVNVCTIIILLLCMHADIDECRRRDLHTCVNARCDNTNGSFVCTCNPGFMSDGSNSCIGKYQLLLSTLSLSERVPCTAIIRC